MPSIIKNPAPISWAFSVRGDTGPESIFIFVSLTKVARICSLGVLGGLISGVAYTKKRFQANYSCSADQNTFAKKYIRLYPHRPVAFIEMNSIYYQQVQKKKTLVLRVS